MWKQLEQNVAQFWNCLTVMFCSSRIKMEKLENDVKFRSDSRQSDESEITWIIWPDLRSNFYESNSDIAEFIL